MLEWRPAKDASSRLAIQKFFAERNCETDPNDNGKPSKLYFYVTERAVKREIAKRGPHDPCDDVTVGLDELRTLFRQQHIMEDELRTIVELPLSDNELGYFVPRSAFFLSHAPEWEERVERLRRLRLEKAKAAEPSDPAAPLEWRPAKDAAIVLAMQKLFDRKNEHTDLEDILKPDQLYFYVTNKQIKVHLGKEGQDLEWPELFEAFRHMGIQADDAKRVIDITVAPREIGYFLPQDALIRAGIPCEWEARTERLPRVKSNGGRVNEAIGGRGGR